MRKSNNFSAVHPLFLHVPASINCARRFITLLLCLFTLGSQAQVTKTINGTVTYHSGISETTLSAPQGNVVLKLPQSMSGKTISGTVSLEPSGKNTKEKNKNLDELKKMVISLGDQKIPLASISETNKIVDWILQTDKPGRIPINLNNSSGTKIAEVSLPPALPTLPAVTWQQDNTPYYTTSSNMLVKGDLLNVYTNSQFTPGQKFSLTDGRGQKFTVNPIALSANQAVIAVPPSASPGSLTIRDDVQKNPGITRVNLIDFSLSSPNTNLRPGQKSFVQLVLHTGSSARPEDNGSAFANIDPKITERDTAEAMQIPIMSIDLRNLNPNTVTMEGGNLQRFKTTYDRSKLMDGEAARLEFQLTRTITGVKPGSFSVSATLHEDYTSSNDPFRPQLNVLKTPEDFNAWTHALKKDLKDYAGIQNNDPAGQITKTNVQRAIDHMPTSSSPEQLDESKAVAYSLLQPLQIPKGAAMSFPSSIEATKAAVKDISNHLAGNDALIDYDVLRNGTAFINRIGERLNDGPMQTICKDVEQLIEKIQTGNDTKENLQQLHDKMTGLTTIASSKLNTVGDIIAKTGMNGIMRSSYQLPSNAQPGRPHPYNDLAGILDPVKKTLSTTPEYRQQILSSLNAVEQADGSYRIQSTTATGKPISYLIRVFASPGGYNFDEQDWLVEYLNERALKDTNRGTMITTYKDSTGTWYRFWKDAKCEGVGGESSLDCSEEMDHTWKEDGTLESRKTGRYAKYVWPALSYCKKGTDFCTEVLQVWKIIYHYSDKACTILKSVETDYAFGCK